MSERKPRAVFSECETHQAGLCGSECQERRFRYQLWWPTGVENDRVALGIFSNPSIATEISLDPTLTRWRNYCREWGYGWSVTGNVRAWRETNPKLVPDDTRAIGPDNDRHLYELIRRADLVVCGWGRLGGWRGPDVISLIVNAGKMPHALKLNKDGSPCHPLYLSSKLKPFPMDFP